MQSGQKVKSEMFIHNDEMTCFHVVVHGTQKITMMGHHNFKDRVLVKRQQVAKKKQDMREADGQK